MSSITQYKLKNGSKLWRIQYTVEIDPLTGEKKRGGKRGFKTKHAAETGLAQILSETNNHGFKQDEKTTYRAVYNYFIDSYKNTVKGSTLHSVEGKFKNQILPSFGDKPIKSITTPMCQALVNKWASEYKDYKKSKVYAAMIFKEAKRLKIIYENPMDGIITPKTKSEITDLFDGNFLDRDELKHHFECINEKFSKKNYKVVALFRLLGFTGIRKGEALALTVSDYNRVDKTININKTATLDKNAKTVIGTPKTAAAYRILSIDDKTASILNKWIFQLKQSMLIRGYNVNSDSDQLLFPNRKNGILAPSMPGSWLTQLYKDYDLKEITPHGFRHTFATLALESNELTIKQVQYQMGHSDPEILLKIYAHITKKAERETIDKFTSYVTF